MLSNGNWHWKRIGQDLLSPLTSYGVFQYEMALRKGVRVQMKLGKVEPEVETYDGLHAITLRSGLQDKFISLQSLLP